ncbi:MAG: PepSY domain-containing protein [Gammaproteobacteria bacterium]|nr:PepSY domain-containing protein [Gammaproteobacteria bacterium]
MTAKVNCEINTNLEPAKSPAKTKVQRALSSHAFLGLTLSILLFLICLSGSLVVFFEEFERWEQPQIPEYSNYTAPQLETALDAFLDRVEEVPESIYLVLPTAAVPRIHIAGDNQEWFVAEDGALLEPPVEGWTYFLKELHISLHLPHTIGLIIVGAFGAMLLGLIITGVLAHPRIIKDAFLWRRHNSERLKQVDLHNRLGVWGIPFFVMIALTGAFIGLVSVLILVTASAFYQNDREAVVDEVYGPDIQVNAELEPVNFRAILTNFAAHDDSASPIYLVLQNYGTRQQFVEVAATLPERLIYSEIYRYHVNGEYINQQGMSNGPWGQQLAYSVYRLHFGHFGSAWVKVLYFCLGIALTVVCVSGVNIWLLRRQPALFYRRAWTAMVWGTPMALALSMFAIGKWFSAGQLFISGVALSLVIAFCCRSYRLSRCLLQLITAAILVFVVIAHRLLFDYPVQLDAINGVNAGCILLALGLVVSAVKTLFEHAKLAAGEVTGAPIQLTDS